MDFKNYLFAKKIDSAAFQLAEKTTYDEYSLLFNQMHPDSFTAQKLFLINQIRRKYPIQNTEPVEAVKKPVKVKPKVMIRKK